MQPVPYLTRSSFFPAVEAALDAAGADFDELKVYLGRRGYERDEIIEVPGPDGEHLSTSWRGHPGRFSARIRAAATVLHRRGIHGRFRAIHADGLLTLRRESRTRVREHDQHDWRCTAHMITTLLFDAASVRIQSWRMDGGVEIRFGAPFTLTAPDGARTSIDPEQPTTGAPLLALLGHEIQQLAISRGDDLTLTLAGGWCVVAAPHPRYEAWEVEVGGPEGTERHVCMPGGATPAD